jgi:hypothetical protein
MQTMAGERFMAVVVLAKVHFRAAKGIHKSFKMCSINEKFVIG